LTPIPFFSFGNIIAIKATDFEIRTVSKSEQRTAVGCGRLMSVFEGVNCDHVDKVVTETYSMKWMCSGLRAPV
jgi:hypothetical protein